MSVQQNSLTGSALTAIVRPLSSLRQDQPKLGGMARSHRTILMVLFVCILAPGCGTLAHRHMVGMNDNGRVDLWPPYGGVETDLRVLRDTQDDHSVSATLWRPFFLLDCPVSAVADTLFLPEWALLKAMHKGEPPPRWRKREAQREETPAPSEVHE